LTTSGSSSWANCPQVMLLAPERTLEKSVTMNQTLKEILKKISPPIIVDAYNSLRTDSIHFKGVYTTWAEAAAHATGYDAGNILAKVTTAMDKVRSGEAAYERDAMTLERKAFTFPLLSALLRSALLQNGKLSVLDFGGSLGSVYFQNREFLSVVPELRWSVIEQKNFVDQGKARFQDEVLKFYYTIEECIQHERPTVALFSGVLQYIAEPYALLDKVIGLHVPSIIIDRTPTSRLTEDILTVQVVPRSLYSASYPCRIFGNGNLTRPFQDAYALMAEYDALDGTAKHARTPVYFRGFIFNR